MKSYLQVKDVSDLQVLCAVEKYLKVKNTSYYSSPWDILCEEIPGLHYKVGYRAVMRAMSAGLLDYGVSVRCCFITNKGNEILNASGLVEERNEKLLRGVFKVPTKWQTKTVDEILEEMDKKKDAKL